MTIDPNIEIVWKEPGQDLIPRRVKVAEKPKPQSVFITLITSLKERPGKWAVYPLATTEQGSLMIASAIKRRVGPGFETKFVATHEVSTTGKPGVPRIRGEVFVRYVGVTE